ncbi:Ku protein [Aquabacter sp. CN5-332]|uniref:non-homologous end joining protein Ku n=1 Tax=Aquabacter sp. CN5-332 TaxID=3156608 RepID=UPI0032B3280C
MAPRATWKGFLKVAELSCAVGLYTAVSAAHRISFRTVDRTSGHAVRRRFVDEETGDVVEREDQVKGYQTGSGDHILIEPEEVAATVPESDKTLSVAGFLPCGKVDTVYLDQPYFLAPVDAVSAKVFAVIRAGMAAKGVAALAEAVLFRRSRMLLLNAHEGGMIATTLHFDHEVRAEDESFSGIKDIKVEGEMLELATHIIDTKRGAVDPHEFEDRYEAALTELVKLKLEGKPIKPRKAPARANVVDLMDALRQSAGKAGKPAAKKTAAGKPAAKKPATRATTRRKAS